MAFLILGCVASSRAIFFDLFKKETQQADPWPAQPADPWAQPADPWAQPTSAWAKPSFQPVIKEVSRDLASSLTFDRLCFFFPDCKLYNCGFIRLWSWGTVRNFPTQLILSKNLSTCWQCESRGLSQQLAYRRTEWRGTLTPFFSVCRFLSTSHTLSWSLCPSPSPCPSSSLSSWRPPSPCISPKSVSPTSSSTSMRKFVSLSYDRNVNLSFCILFPSYRRITEYHNSDGNNNGDKNMNAMATMVITVLVMEKMHFFQ